MKRDERNKNHCDYLFGNSNPLVVLSDYRSSRKIYSNNIIPMTHPAYILVDAEGKVIAISESNGRLMNMRIDLYALETYENITRHKSPLLILPAEVKWEMPKDQQI